MVGHSLWERLWLISSRWCIMHWLKITKNDGLETQNVNISIGFWIFELVLVPSFNLNWQLRFYRPKHPKKGILDWKQKSEYHHQVFHIWISLGTKLHFKPANLIFCAKFSQKVNFRSLFKASVESTFKPLIV